MSAFVDQCPHPSTRGGVRFGMKCLEGQIQGMETMKSELHPLKLLTLDFSHDYKHNERLSTHTTC